MPETQKAIVSHFEEVIGKGIQAMVKGKQIKIGSASFIGFSDDDVLKQTQVYVAIDNTYKVKFIFDNQYRDGLELLFRNLSKRYELKVFSGDNEGERESLEQLLPRNTELVFNQKPEQKLAFIELLQKQGNNVLMIGDGRIQGVLLDNKSINVAYDYVRGEKEIGRAKFII